MSADKKYARKMAIQAYQTDPLPKLVVPQSIKTRLLEQLRNIRHLQVINYSTVGVAVPVNTTIALGFVRNLYKTLR